MYGLGVFVALDRRRTQIEAKVWSQRSPRCFVSIAVLLGLISWGTIVATTILLGLHETIISVIAMWHLIVPLPSRPLEGWDFLPTKIATALPWFLAGATASTLLACLLGRDPRRTTKSDRCGDAAVPGFGLGVAAAFAQGMQMSVIYQLASNSLDYWHLISKSGAVGLAGCACGMVVGFMVPAAYRRSIITPIHTDMGRALRGLRQRAESALSGASLAENWIFTPNHELGGISPAEAIQYKTLVNKVSRLLDGEPPQKFSESPLRIAS